MLAHAPRQPGSWLIFDVRQRRYEHIKRGYRGRRFWLEEEKDGLAVEHDVRSLDRLRGFALGKRNIVKILTAILALLLVSSFSCLASSDSNLAVANDKPIQMKPFSVMPGMLDIGIVYNGVTKKMYEVTIRWACSYLVKELGLREGDKLTSIDGKLVSDMSLSEFSSRFHWELKGKEKTQFIFTGRRGFFRVPKIIKFSFEGVEPSEPNKALVPTVTSVTPAADAPVAPAAPAAHL